MFVVSIARHAEGSPIPATGGRSASSIGFPRRPRSRRHDRAAKACVKEDAGRAEHSVLGELVIARAAERHAQYRPLRPRPPDPSRARRHGRPCCGWSLHVNSPPSFVLGMGKRMVMLVALVRIVVRTVSVRVPDGAELAVVRRVYLLCDAHDGLLLGLGIPAGAWTEDLSRAVIGATAGSADRASAYFFSCGPILTQSNVRSSSGTPHAREAPRAPAPAIGRAGNFPERRPGSHVRGEPPGAAPDTAEGRTPV